MPHTDKAYACEQRIALLGGTSHDRKERMWKKDKKNGKAWILSPTHTLTLRRLHMQELSINKQTNKQQFTYAPFEKPAAILLNLFPGDQSRQRHWPNSDQSALLTPTGTRRPETQLCWTTIGSGEQEEKRK